MRTFIAVAVVLGFTSVAVPPRAAAEPPVPFQVPSPERVADGEWALPTHELLLPADFVAKPGESFEEVVERALAGAPQPSGDAG